MSAIPLADAPALRRPARLTFVVRAALAAVAIGCAVAALFVSRHPQTQTIVPLPHTASTIVVLDVSASISSDTYSRIGGTLAALAKSGKRLGLVVFSDSAYEALPPGVPSSDLTPYVRYFTLPPQPQNGAAQSFPANPWATSFSGGTHISSGLDLAHQIAVAQPRRSTVLLVSDLDDDPNDVAALSTIAAAYQRDRVPLRVVGLNPSPQDVALFQKLLGGGVAVSQAPTLDQVSPHNETAFPWTLFALAFAAGLALALSYAWSPQLEWSEA
jgi:hypothetical protein